MAKKLLRYVENGTLSYGTVEYCNHILRRLYHNQNFLCVITGPTGSGKSYSMLKLMEILNPEKTPEEIIKNVAFDAHEYMARINSGELKPFDALGWDESGVGLSSRNWQSLANKSINYLLQTYRNMNLIGLFTLPYFTFLDAQSRKLMHSLIQTEYIDRNTNEAILKPYLLIVSQHTGKIYNPYLTVMTEEGTIKVEGMALGLPSARLIELYEEKKKQFTIKLNQNIDKMLHTARKKENKEIDNLTERQREAVTLYEQGNTMEKVAVLMGVSTPVISNLIKSARLRGKVIKKLKNGIENGGF